MSSDDVLMAFAVALASLIGAYFGSYFRRKGENLATKEDISRITRLTEEVRSEIETHAWQSQRWWEEKKAIYARVIAGLNRIIDGLWNILSYGFDPTTKRKIPEAMDGKVVTQLMKDIDEHMQHTGIAYVFVSDQALAVLTEWAATSRKLHSELLQQGKEYEYFNELKIATDAAYNSIINAAKADLRGRIGAA